MQTAVGDVPWQQVLDVEDRTGCTPEATDGLAAKLGKMPVGHGEYHGVVDPFIDLRDGQDAEFLLRLARIRPGIMTVHLSAHDPQLVHDVDHAPGAPLLDTGSMDWSELSRAELTVMAGWPGRASNGTSG